MEEKNEKSIYSYSAKEQEEIKNIREKYAPQTEKESSMEQLRRLDASATKGAIITSLIFGVVSSLILGTGMWLALTLRDRLFIQGIVIGIIGIAGMIATYPIYTHMVKSKRAKLAPEILRLSDELMK